MTLRSFTGVLAVLLLTGCQNAPELPEPPHPDPIVDLEDAVRIAIKKARRQVVDASDDGAAWLRLGKTYEANGLPGEAARCYETAALLLPDHAETWYRLGRARTKIGLPNQALSAFTSAAELDSTGLHICLRLGFVRLETSDLVGAQSDFKRASGMDAANSAATTGLARVALQRGDNEKAASLLEDLIAVSPGELYYRNLLGRAYRSLGRHDEASELLKGGGARPMPRLRDPWEDDLDRFAAGFAGDRDRAFTAFAQGNFPEAIRMLEELVAKRPGDGSLRYALGVAYMQSGKAQRAVEVLAAGVRFNAGHNLLRGALADAYVQSGQLEPALAEARKAVELNETHFSTHFRVAGILNTMGRKKEALESAEEALRRDPDQSQGLQLAARLYRSFERWSEAASAYDRLTGLHPEDGRFCLWLGITRMKTGAFDEAARLFSKADSLGGSRRWRRRLERSRVELARLQGEGDG